MNQQWLDYLNSLQVTQQSIVTAGGKGFFPQTGLAVLEVTGRDAAGFLQGQLTCNVNELSLEKASLAGFCTAKGRVISILLCLKTEAGFLLILPASLLEKVQKKLQMYVLRSAVVLQDSRESLCVLGLAEGGSESCRDLAHCAVAQRDGWVVRLPTPEPQYLQICHPLQALAHSQEYQRQGLLPGSVDEWRFLAISAGIPWLEIEQSEQYIPQMLNLDQLAGISFNKGCYTGQEIVARAHYLGQVKRSLFLGECAANVRPAADMAVLDAEGRQPLGSVLSMQSQGDRCRLLMVLQTVDGQAKKLILDDEQHSQINVIPFQ